MYALTLQNLSFPIIWDDALAEQSRSTQDLYNFCIHEEQILAP